MGYLDTPLNRFESYFLKTTATTAALASVACGNMGSYDDQDPLCGKLDPAVTQKAFAEYNQASDAQDGFIGPHELATELGLTVFDTTKATEAIADNPDTALSIVREYLDQHDVSVELTDAVANLLKSDPYGQQLIANQLLLAYGKITKEYTEYTGIKRLVITDYIPSPLGSPKGTTFGLFNSLNPDIVTLLYTPTQMFTARNILHELTHKEEYMQCPKGWPSNDPFGSMPEVFIDDYVDAVPTEEYAEVGAHVKEGLYKEMQPGYEQRVGAILMRIVSHAGSTGDEKLAENIVEYWARLS